MLILRSVKHGLRKIFHRSREDCVKETAPIPQLLSSVYHRSPPLYGVESKARSGANRCALEDGVSLFPSNVLELLFCFPLWQMLISPLCLCSLSLHVKNSAWGRECLGTVILFITFLGITPHSLCKKLVLVQDSPVRSTCNFLS